MTHEIISVLAAFAPLFTRPTWKNINTLIIGAILCRGVRRITSILRVMGLGHVNNFSKYHRVLSRARWDSLAASKILFGLLITLLPTQWPIIIAVDETLERRRGKKIKAKGAYRDAVASSQSRVVICFGLKWECMTLIVPLPWCNRPWALPFLIILSPSKKSDETAGKRHKTSIDWTIQMVRCVSRWLKRKSWILVGDGAYACMALAKACINSGATLISRLRLDAQLYESPVAKKKGRRGRPQVKGKRIQLKELLVDPDQAWQTLTVKWYGGEQRIIECLTFECLWYHAGELTLGDIIMIIRRSIWVKMYFSMSKNQEKNTDSLKITEKNANLLIYQLALAA